MNKINIKFCQAVLFASVLVLALLLLTGTRIHADYYNTITTPDGLILQENSGQITGMVYEVTGYSDKLGTDVVIPEYYNDIPIVTIKQEAFMNNTSLKSVLIPASVYNLERRAFKGCTALESVVFAGDAQAWRKEKWPKLSDVRPIFLGSSLFEDCTSLTSLELNFGWEVTGSSGIIKNSGVRYLKLVLPNTFGQSDETSAFNECPELEKLDIILKKKTSGINLNNYGYFPKLKEINIYQEQDEDFASRVASTLIDCTHYSTYIAFEKSPLSQCPLLECINVYVDSKVAINGQFKSFINTKPDAAFEGSCVKRFNDNGNTFVIQSEGTAIFSCEEVPFKVRLIVGGEASKKSIADCKLTLAEKELIFTGTERIPYLYLTDGKTLLEEDKDYTVSAKDNTSIGTATVTVTGIGDYDGTLSGSFSIIPVHTNVRSVKIGKKESTIVLNDNQQADGYQIYYSSKKSKNFKKLYSGADTKAVVTKLKSGMYIKVRTYKKVGKTTYYSAWSAPVQVK